MRSLHGIGTRITTAGATLLMALATALIPGGAGSAAHAATAPPPLKVISYNICGQSNCQSALTRSAWGLAMQQAITAYDPDVVDLQEVCNGQADELQSRLPGYKVEYLVAEHLRTEQTGCLKWGSDGTVFGAAMLVKAAETPVFQTQTLQPVSPVELLHPDHLSEPRPLICANATTAAGQNFQACNVHLDGGVGGLRAQGLPVVINRMQYWGQGRPTVLTGDFNADPTDPNMGLLYEAQEGNGSFIEADERNRSYFPPACRHLTACRSGRMTTHDSSPLVPVGDARKFDYIFGSAADFVPSQTETLDVFGPDGSTLSDHMMYRSVLSWNRDTTAPSAPSVLNDPAVIGTGNDWANAVDRTAGVFTKTGRTDMVLRYANGTVMLYPGDGTGKFGAGQQLATGWSDAQSITAGDFTGDGHADLLVRWNYGSVFLYPGDGDGHLGGSIPLPSAGNLANALNVTAGHVSARTGAEDIVVRWNDDPTKHTSHVTTQSVVKQTQNGKDTYTVTTPVTLKPGGSDTLTDVADLVTGDFSGGGLADLLVRGDNGSLTLYSGEGATPYASALPVADNRRWSDFKAPYQNWLGVEDLTAGDFNGDGKTDLVIHWMNQYSSDGPADGQTEFLKSPGLTATDTTLTFAVTTGLKWASPSPWGNAPDVLVADFDADPGKSADLLTSTPDGSMTLRPNYGDGTFPTSTDLAQNVRGSRGLVAGDFNGDGAVDVLSRDSLNAILIPGDPQNPGTFLPSTTAPFDLSLWANVADVTSGHFHDTTAPGSCAKCSDLVFRYNDGHVALLLGAPNGFATTLSTVSAAGTPVNWSDAASVIAGDFNGDGKDDLLVRWNAGSAFLYPGDGKGGFGGSVQVVAAGTLSDLADLTQGAVYGSGKPVSNLYRWSDGTLLVDRNRSTDLTKPARGTVSGPDARFVVRSSDDRGRVASFEYTLDGGAVVRLDAAHNSLAVPLTALAVGDHTLSVVAVDLAGNRSAPTVYPFTRS